MRRVPKKAGRSILLSLLVAQFVDAFGGELAQSHEAPSDTREGARPLGELLLLLDLLLERALLDLEVEALLLVHELLVFGVGVGERHLCCPLCRWCGYCLCGRVLREDGYDCEDCCEHSEYGVDVCQEVCPARLAQDHGAHPSRSGHEAGEERVSDHLFQTSHSNVSPPSSSRTLIPAVSRSRR